MPPSQLVHCQATTRWEQINKSTWIVSATLLSALENFPGHYRLFFDLPLAQGPILCSVRAVMFASEALKSSDETLMSSTAVLTPSIETFR